MITHLYILLFQKIAIPLPLKAFLVFTSPSPLWKLHFSFILSFKTFTFEISSIRIFNTFLGVGMDFSQNRTFLLSVHLLCTSCHLFCKTALYTLFHYFYSFRKPTHKLNIDDKEYLNFATFNFLGFVGNEKIEV